MKPDIFTYTSYRLYLKDFYEYRKELNPHFSYRLLASKVGFKSAGHFTQIVKGKTNISPHLLHNFSIFLKLKKRENEFFELLVKFDHSKTQEEKNSYYERIISFKEIRATVLTVDQYEFYSKWYYAVVRDLLSIFKFYGDYKKLANLVYPAISIKEAHQTIKLLLKLKLVRKNDDGHFEVIEKFIHAPQGSDMSPALTNYAMGMIEKAKEAVNTMPVNERHIAWAGFSVSEETYHKITDELRECRKKVMALVEKEDNPERVYHLNIQYFPVSQNKNSPHPSLKET